MHIEDERLEACWKRGNDKSNMHEADLMSCSSLTQAVPRLKVLSSG